jgi:hypothetical protein
MTPAELEAQATAKLDEFRAAREERPVSRPRPELAPEALHGIAGDFVRVLEPHTEADPAALLTSFLVGFGKMVGRSAHVQVEADRHYANLYAVLVGETSRGRKGTSWGQARRPLEAVELDWAARVLSGASSGEGIIWAVRDPIVKREAVKEKGRPTGEIQEVLVDAGVDDKRLLLLESEFASVLRVLNREGNNLSPLLRLAWDRGDLATLTKNSPARATGAHVSILGHVTRNELVLHLDGSETANGFGNRFLWACVRRSKCLPEGGAADRIDWRPLVKRLAAATEQARRLGGVAKDPEAKRLWASAYPALTADRPGMVGALTARAEAQVIRLALVYALLDSAREIRAEHLVAALALWDFCDRSVSFVFGDSTGDPDADAILAALRADPAAGLSRSDVRDLFGRHRSSARIEAALGRLADAGLARSESIVTGGRPSEIWRADLPALKSLSAPAPKEEP